MTFRLWRCFIIPLCSYCVSGINHLFFYKVYNGEGSSNPFIKIHAANFVDFWRPFGNINGHQNAIWTFTRVLQDVFQVISCNTREKSTGGHEGRLDDLDLLNPVELGLVHQLVKLGDDVVEDVQRLRRVLVREEGSELRQADRNLEKCNFERDHNMTL